MALSAFQVTFPLSPPQLNKLRPRRPIRPRIRNSPPRRLNSPLKRPPPRPDTQPNPPNTTRRRSRTITRPQKLPPRSPSLLHRQHTQRRKPITISRLVRLDPRVRLIHRDQQQRRLLQIHVPSNSIRSSYFANRSSPACNRNCEPLGLDCPPLSGSGSSSQEPAFSHVAGSLVYCCSRFGSLR